MGEFVLYKALQSHVPNEETGLQFQKDDVLQIPVQSPIASNTYPTSGLYAYNRRTGEEGYVPVELVKLLGSEVNNTIHHPSAVGVEASHSSCNMQETDLKSKCHRWKDVYIVRPIICTHCRDYIWGCGKVGTTCVGEFCEKLIDFK